MRFSRLTIVAAAVCSAAFSSTAAFAQSGYMTCLLYRATGGGGPRTYYTYPFQADSADEDAMTSIFQTVAVESGMLQSTDQTLGGCHWEAKKNQAFGIAKGFLAKYRGNEFDFSRAMESKLKGR